MEADAIARSIDWSSSRVLITQAHLLRFMGSEIATLELAEFLADLGADVIVVTHTYGAPIRHEFDRLPVRVFEIDDPELEAELQNRPPDLAWIHHHVIPETLVRDPGACIFVFSHMSGVTPGELPMSTRVERELSSASLFVSEEARELQVNAESFAGFVESRLMIWPNPAPDSFASAVRSSQRPHRVAIISNHIPSEVYDALPALREHYEVDLFGSQRELGANPRRVTADEIARCDAVITIGKTVQYALSAGTAVYCYDHFGGPGWITAETIGSASRVNFSGRGAPRRSAPELVADFRGGIDHAIRDAVRSRSDRVAQYSLSARWEALDQFLTSQPKAAPKLTRDDVVSHLNTQMALTAYVRQWTLARGDADFAQEVISSLSVTFRARIRRRAMRALRRVTGA